MPSYRFVEVTARATKSLTCLDCGKRRRRQTTFMNTVNPFNTNEDGSVRTYAQVLERVRAQAAEFEPTLCASCEPEHRPERYTTKRDEFVGNCLCGRRWPCELTEDFATLEAQGCLCQPVGRICARCTRLGRKFDKPVST